ncbi:adult-specific rigid cuticular protein 11.9-like [Parasteatoda tepidariorum]|uniref:adult-specific rigid cuticular protein 11.9-like n=1 Tax=Parasteatoda tepidariorum TaxID=114398 RepID=UPI00077FD6D6|nr:adult-specific rigid cuticular protein 11.9-like [Parasteatoda tepidariorum]
MRFIIASLLLASVAMAADMGMNIAGGAYNFGYNTGDAGGHSRSESGSAGNVAGSYSYIDANGDRRVVSYSAGPQGYQASGDIGVDRKTAAAAAALAAMAPKAPIAPAPAAPGHYGAPWAAPAPMWAPAPQAIMGPSGYQAKW